LDGMLMLSSSNTRVNVPVCLGREIPTFLFSREELPPAEKPFAAGLDGEGDAPGGLENTLARGCRTWVDDLTRAVPHGSFL